MKNKLLIILLFIIGIGVGIIAYYMITTSVDGDLGGKFYLEQKYYGKNDFVKVNSKDISRLRKENYLLFTYNNYCTFPKPCEDVFKEFITHYNVAILSIPFDEYKKTSFYKKVRYAPSVIIVKNGNVVDYLDANSDLDLARYQDADEFRKWLEKSIYFTKKK